MDEQFSNHEYRTGPTQPQKSHRGPIALLLMLIIFLSGLICAMGLFNIRLSLWLDNTAPASPPVSFSQGNGDSPDLGISDTPENSVVLAGMTCQEPTELCRDLYDLPQGLYVAAVADGSPADLLGIAPGDVLTHFAGTAVSRLTDLQSQLDRQAAGTRVEITTNRKGKQLRHTLTLDN